MLQDTAAANERGDGTGVRFRAFVSYAHADAGEARRLQRTLETYRVPARLAARFAPIGSEQGRVGPVFRDREDLSAASDLSAAVREALAASRALIVVCTPAATQSRWVAREIELFRQLHPDRPVLAALFAGTPETAFPAPLTSDGAEPLAADFRRRGDGRRLAFLKVVAGILGIPLDELIQRDAQRKLRRVTAVTVSSLLAMLGLAAMTTFAILSRRQAEAEARNTRELNRFFVTDFRKELLANGRLDIAMKFYPRVLSYCEAQNSAALASDEGRESCAEVLRLMGVDFEAAGDLASARGTLEAAWSVTGKRLANDPGNPARVLDHAESENRLGLLAVAEKRREQAERHFFLATKLAERIADWGRTRPHWLRQSAYMHANLGSAILRRDGAAGKALPLLERAVADNRALIAASPEDGNAPYDLVFHLQWLADAQWRLDHAADARRTADEYLKLITQLVSTRPADMVVREQQMQVLLRHAELLAREGMAGEAAPFVADARSLADLLTARDPDNAGWAAYRERIDRLTAKGN